MFDEDDFGFAEAALAYTPPPSQKGQDRLARLRLIRSHRVGPSTYRRLLAEHGSAEAALTALPGVAEKAGVSCYRPCDENQALAEMKAAKAAGAEMICLGDARYPTNLAQANDAPPVLWALGDPDLLTRRRIAIVGARNASSLGARMTRRLTTGLGEAGLVVVSGLARGIDTLAHKASLETGTIAVQAGGLDQIYPAENTELAQDIARRGLCLSEQPFGLVAQARHFPRRNRIVAGLSEAVIVVEAAAKSGTLITARLALDLGRDVMAVPGHPLDSRASGCNLLLRDGAALVRSADDVLELLAPDQEGEDDAEADTLQAEIPGLAVAPAAPDQAELRAAILAKMGVAPLPEDQLIRDLATPAAQVAPVLAELEIDGRIERLPGGHLSLAQG
ncbi:MAG: DNA-processing protein DprA [Pseudomonadota bacterium]